MRYNVSVPIGRTIRYTRENRISNKNFNFQNRHCIVTRVLSMNWEDSSDENKSKHDYLQNILNHARLKFAQNRYECIVENSPNEVVFGLIFVERNSPPTRSKIIKISNFIDNHPTCLIASIRNDQRR